MAATTRWIDTENCMFDSILNTMLSSTQSENNINGETAEYINWKVEKLFLKNEIIEISGKEITFNCVKYSFDQIIPGVDPIEDRIINKDGKIIVYTTGYSINYIINRNSDAKLVLRRLLDYSGKMEIERNCIEITSDMFVWMISKVYTNDNSIAVESHFAEQIILDCIRGFKGDTDDLLTKVSAYGESVMNIISTLSFLLESRNITQVKVDIKHAKHDNIELILSTKGTVETIVGHYQGILDEEENFLLIEAKLYLIIYLEILPLLFQAYRRDISNKDWNQEKYIEFLNSVALELQNKVNLKVESMKVLTSDNNGGE